MAARGRTIAVASNHDRARRADLAASADPLYQRASSLIERLASYLGVEPPRPAARPHARVERNTSLRAITRALGACSVAAAALVAASSEAEARDAQERYLAASAEFEETCHQSRELRRNRNRAR